MASIIKHLDGKGTTYVNGKPQGTVFGADMVIAQEKAQISGKWDMGLNLRAPLPTIVGTGYMKVQENESTFEIGTGTDANGSFKLISKTRVRYEPGAPIFAKFTAAFPKIEDSNGDYTCGMGLGDYSEGWFLAQRRRNNVLEYGFILLRGGIEEWFDYNGELPENMNNLIIYRLEAGYLGVAPTNLYWRDTVNEVFKRFHRQTYAQRVTSVKKPDLPVSSFVRNEGNTTNITLLNGSFEAGTINGGTTIDPNARIETYERSFTATSGTNQTIFSFKNPLVVEMYDYFDINAIPTTREFNNSINSQLLQIAFEGIGANKLVDINLYAIPIDDVTSGTYTPVRLGFSVLSVSDDAVVDFTNARKLSSFVLNFPKNISFLDLLHPGEVAIFVYSTTSTNFDFKAFMKFQDLF